MKAVILDMDGVIVDTENHWAEAEKEIYREATGESVDTKQYSGMSITNTYHELSEKFGTEVSEEEFLQLYADRAEKIYREKASIRDGMKDLVDKLSSINRLKLGMVTGSYWPEYVIERFSLEFDEVITPEEISGNGKPEPEIYSLMLERLGVKSKEALTVEDSDPGVSAAKSAGIYCIGLRGTENQTLEEADEIVNSPSDLFERISSII
ncbi:MAG: HAD superfamily hydrolase (TIGR01509 family) [Candidatus Nanohaloarchaea archaeon]|jgi:HAD superfamily hydrolase (TIGR01509 family)